MIESSDDVRSKYKRYLNDESGIFKKGFAEKIFFPKSEDEIIDLVSKAKLTKTPITISGGGTGISGGRAPIGGWIIATDKMLKLQDPVNPFVWKDGETGIEYQLDLIDHKDGSGSLKVPISMTIKAIQNFTRQHNWHYPPDPTERSCFIGGNIITNASGARSFKFGPTRNWVQSLRIVLPSGEMIKLNRNDPDIKKGVILVTEKNKYELEIPTYPKLLVSKNVAGPVLSDDSKAIDLFIGSDGLFGIITQVELKIIKEPKSILTFFVFCPTKEHGLDLIKICQENKIASRHPIPMSVELLDDRAIQIMRNIDHELPQDSEVLLIIEQDVLENLDTDKIIEDWYEIFTNLGIDEILLAQTYSEIEHFKELRHAVPETVNSLVRSNGQAKIGSDLSVPWKHTKWLFDRCWELGKEFEKIQNSKDKLEKYGYALWAHAGDAHVHLNLIPRNDEEYHIGNQIILRLIKEVISKGGSMAAEHGLGKKYFDGKPALYYQIGQNGIDFIKKMKKVLDPNFILNRGNLTGYEEYL